MTSPDYTPIFIGVILDTIGKHFDQHNTDHAMHSYQLAKLEQRLETLMTQPSGQPDAMGTALTDLDKFMTDVSARVTELEKAFTDLQNQIGSSTQPDPALEAAAARIENAIAAARATIDASPPIPAPAGAVQGEPQPTVDPATGITYSTLRTPTPAEPTNPAAGRGMTNPAGATQGATNPPSASA